MACWDLRRGSLTRLLSGFAHRILRRPKLVHCHRLWSQLNPPHQCLIHQFSWHSHCKGLSTNISPLCGTILVHAEGWWSLLKSSVMIQRGFSHGISGDGVEGNSSRHAAHLLPQAGSYPWQSQQVLFQCLKFLSLQNITLLLCTQRMSCLMPDTFLIYS